MNELIFSDRSWYYWRYRWISNLARMVYIVIPKCHNGMVSIWINWTFFFTLVHRH